MRYLSISTLASELLRDRNLLDLFTVPNSCAALRAIALLPFMSAVQAADLTLILQLRRV